MYSPAHFSETRLPVLQALMQAYPLATLVTLGPGGLVADHIPLHFTPADGAAAPGLFGTLRGHVARANPLWRETDLQTDVLAVFQGPQAYVSPSWYPSKQVDGRVVPTWNYVVVQAGGRLLVHDDPQWTGALVGTLTQVHEAARPAPWAMHDAPPEYLAKMMGAIVGIEIPVTRLVGKWKTSGNHPPANRAGVAAGLAASASESDRRMAALVAAHDAAPAADQGA